MTNNFGRSAILLLLQQQSLFAEKKIQNGKLDETMSSEREIVRRFAQERQIEHEALKVPSRKSKRDV